MIPYEHQLAAVKTALNRMRGRALLANEVGLGKTVEAAIILAELWRRRLVRRVLVLTPPGLVTQWQEELRRKACLDFVSHDVEPFRQTGREAWQRFERVVASFHPPPELPVGWRDHPDDGTDPPDGAGLESPGRGRDAGAPRPRDGAERPPP